MIPAQESRPLGKPRANGVSHWLACGIILGLTLLLFGTAVWRNEVFAFRDAGLFYYPLFQWTTWEWGAGRIPLWNPYEGWGTPVLADATSSVFYPGKLLFMLPLSFARLFVLYAVFHLLLGAAGTVWLTRRWNASFPAATIAAVAYAFGGSVLFQYTNIVFLVGAAWLPWGVLWLWQLLVQPTWRAMFALSAVLALLVLGGDPQMVVHLAFVAVIGLFARSRRHWFDRRTQHSLTAIAAAFAFAFGLAAVQILPSAAYLPRTDRAVYERPRTIYEAIATPDEVAAGLCGVPVAETQHATLYDFSLGPWRWLELLLPNIGGRMFPRNQRWLSHLPAESSVWTPSLYMGLLPALLAVGQLHWRRGNRRTRWLTWIATFFALGSCGWYGGGWVIRELAHSAFGSDTSRWWLGQPTGGLYWFLVVTVPGYVQFRYPAKLWTVVALAVACLAAQGFDRWWRSRQPTATAIGCFALATWGLAILAWLFVPLLFARGVFPADDLWGPFQPAAACGDVIQSCLHAAIVLTTLWFIARSAISHERRTWASVLLVAADVFLANAWQISTLPARDLASPQKAENSALVSRFDPGDWRHDFPPYFRTQPSDHRPQESLAWDRKHGYGRLHLLDGVGSLRPYTTFVPADYELWKQVGGRLIFSARVWSVSRTESLPPLSAADERQLTIRRARVVRIVKAMGNNPAEVAVLEEEASSDLTPLAPVTSLDVRHEQGGELRLKYSAPATARLIINITYDPGWRATLITNGQSQPLPVERANRLMCSVVVPPGNHDVQLTYWPREFIFGAILSGFSWLVWIGVYFFYFFKFPRTCTLS